MFYMLEGIDLLRALIPADRTYMRLLKPVIGFGTLIFMNRIKLQCYRDFSYKSQGRTIAFIRQILDTLCDFCQWLTGKLIWCFSNGDELLFITVILSHTHTQRKCFKSIILRIPVGIHYHGI